MKTIKQKITLNVPANQASAKAPLGPTLGQYGIPIADFCKKFNDLSSSYKDGTLLKVHATLFEDGEYTLDLQIPDLSFFIKKTVGLETSTGNTGKYKYTENIKVNNIISSHALFEICKIKYKNADSEELKVYYKKILGSLKSMGIIVLPSNLLKTE
jgi:large subunit ribosomal protein L11